MHGRVLDGRTGQPIAGARVVASCPSFEAEADPTNAAGVYELEELPLNESLLFEVRAREYVERFARFELRSSRPTERDFELERGRIVHFEVVDFETDQPIEGASVRRGATAVVTDASGGAASRSWLGESQKRLEVTVHAAGYCRLEIDQRVAATTGEERVRVRLPRGARYEGRAVHSDGSPVAGLPVILRVDHHARIRAQHNEGRHADLLAAFPSTWVLGEEQYIQKHETDEEGLFKSAGLLPWSDYYAPRVYFDGRALEQPCAPLGAPGESTWVDIVLPLEVASDHGSIEGVLTVNGVAMGGAVRWSNGAEQGEGEVDESGTFLLKDVPPGEITLAPYPAAGSSRSFGALFADELTRVRLDAGQTVRTDIALEIELSTIAGQTVGPDGTSLPHIHVTARGDGAARAGASTVTDENGHFDLSLPRRIAAYEIKAFRPPTNRGVQHVAVGTRDLRIVLPDIVSARLRVVQRETRVPLERPHVRWRWSDEERFIDFSPRPRPDADGWIELSLPAESVDLLVRELTHDFVPLIRFGWVPADGDRLELELERGTRLGAVLANAPAPEHTNWFLLDGRGHRALDNIAESDAARWLTSQALNPTGDWQIRRLRWDRGTRAELPGLAPGEYFVVGSPPATVMEPGVFTLGPEGLDVELRWRATDATSSADPFRNE